MPALSVPCLVSLFDARRPFLGGAGGGDPAEAAAGAVRLALLPDDGPTGEFLSWDGTPVPW